MSLVSAFCLYEAFFRVLAAGNRPSQNSGAQDSNRSHRGKIEL